MAGEGALLGRAELPGTATSASVARAFVREILRVAGCPDADDAILMVSELVGNAVQHSDSGWRRDGLLTVLVADCGKTIQVDVIDQGSDGRPRPRRDPSENAENGRGLWLVGELASSWGWRRDRRGNVVWFQVPAK
ncbi:ATP-binding protein [Sphaerisporangium fuscum]|uniref:ATP-binding protein n=1 Tax=Sphaerisporangium fuscum TaxID=2835868 RepID=UPI001BDC3CFC|nr:ATP-binding protein [Sphaerisporangium fuscum]